VDIENLTVKQIKEIQNYFSGCKKEESLKEGSLKEERLLEVGKNYMVQTVTNYFIGKLRKNTKNEIALSQCSWIPDTGVYSTALISGIFEEVEPMPDNFLNIIFKSSIINMFEVNFKIPRDKK
jgi:hypothetical protein